MSPVPPISPVMAAERRSKKGSIGDAAASGLTLAGLRLEAGLAESVSASLELSHALETGSRATKSIPPPGKKLASSKTDFTGEPRLNSGWPPVE